MPTAVALYSADPDRLDVHTVLARAGYAVAGHGLDETADPGSELIIVDGLQQAEAARARCARLREAQAERFVPILFVAANAEPSERSASLDSGADAHLPRPFEPTELLAQVRALLRLKTQHDRLAAQAAEAERVTQRLQAAYQQLDQELVLARRIQESLLPQRLPELPTVRFAVRYRPCGQVGGDFYDVFRLDERHLGFYIADAMGHGVPACLLTILLKKGVRPKEIDGQAYRLVPPAEVLQKLNRELVGHALPDTPFVTMVYGLLEHTTGTLRFSRAGHPHPLYLPAAGPPQLWHLPGSLLGVFDTTFNLQTAQLHPGDKLILYTDGVDNATFDTQAAGVLSLVAAAERFRTAPIDELVDRLAQDLFTQSQQVDDLTILGVEMTA